MPTFSEALKEKQAGRSQAAFAAELNADQSTISRILSGQRGKGWRVLANVFAKYPDLLHSFISDYADLEL